MGAVRPFGAVEASARKQTGQVRDTDTEDLLGEDVIHSLIEVADLLLQSLDQAAGDLAQEHARLGEWVEESHIRVRPEVFSIVRLCPCRGQVVEHAVGELRRGEDLVVGEVGDAGQDVRVATSEREIGVGGQEASSPTLTAV